jgi:hypothetical protein
MEGKMAGKTYSNEYLDRLLDSGEPIRVLSIKFNIAETTLRKRKLTREIGGAQTSIPVKESTATPPHAEEIPPQSTKSIVLALPDMHHPFCHPDTLDFLVAVRNAYKPNHYICLGDEVDFHALSRYPKDPDGMGAGGELKAAIEKLIPFYREFPNMRVCNSNHTARGHRQAFGAGIPQAFMAHISQVLNAPDGWSWHQEIEQDGVIYIHGDAGKHGQYAHVNYMKSFKQSVVIGHIHAYAGVNYEGKHFGMNAGCLIDSEAYAFAYGKNLPIKVNLGCGIIIDGKEAYFIPMRTENGRWIGVL